MLHLTRWRPALLVLLALLTTTGAARAQRIAAGVQATLSIHADGTLWAWGTAPATGLGTPYYQPTPLQVGTGTTWRSVVAGGSHALAIRQDGSLWAWGYNPQGQLGLGSTTDQLTPAQVGTATWLSVATNDAHTLAVRADGTLWAWGLNDHGQLGDGTTTQRNAPVQVGTATTWRSVAAGLSTSAALRQDGTLWTWGDTSLGGLGLGSGVTTQNSPAQLSPGTTWQAVALGSSSGVAIRADGTLWSWGNNYDGQLGLGAGVATQATPAQVGTVTTWQSVASSGGFVVALRQNNTLWSWGNNNYGQLGNGVVTRGVQYLPAQAGTVATWQSVAASGFHAVALRQDGSLWTWGNNPAGQIGDGTGLVLAPTLAVVPSSWRSVAAGTAGSAGLKTDGTLWTWGYNFFGQLGNNVDVIAQYAPTQVGTATWQTVAAGYYHNLAIRQDGTLWVWGWNQYGQLGLGSQNNALVPTQVGTATWKAVAGGAYHSLAVRADGTLWAWGSNSTDQLGTGGSTSQLELTPVQVGTATNWASVACGTQHSLALKTDGTLWAWGLNSGGLAGTGSNTYQPTPVQLGTGTWLSVSAGDNHSLAVRADGTLWAWGSNGYGALGTGGSPSTVQTTPIQVGTATTWRSVSAGYYCSMALRQNGTLWTWGGNFAGESGQGSAAAVGSATGVGTPQQVGTTTTWQSLSARNVHGLAIRTDNTLWAWGANSGGTSAQPDFTALPTYIRNGGTTLAAASPAATAGWVLAPNPAREAVQVLGLPAGPVAVQLYDATGRLVREASAASLPTAGLAPGLYLLRATAAGATRMLRLVVE